MTAAPEVPVHSPAYRRIEELIAAERCVVLDGGVATELQRDHPRSSAPGEELWGTWALYRTPQAVRDVHRQYVAVGCDVISTNTWSILSTPDAELRHGPGNRESAHWLDVARLGVQLARQAVDDEGRTGECAVAFAISEDVTSDRQRETVALLARAFQEDPPDLILLETLTLIRDPSTFEAVDVLLETGLPVWLSFRRCRHGVCGVYGQHWGPPEGDLFGRAARRFEQMGVGALLINCLPVEHVPGIIPWLRDFTSLPLGVYPNLGHLAGREWRFDERIGPAEYAQLALEWREEGAQIIGGCCGTSPEHIGAMAAAVADTKPGRKKPVLPDFLLGVERPPEAPPPEPWLDERGRVVNPLPFPNLTVDEGVFVPTHGSYLCWKYLFSEDIGRDKRCLDVGCGCGILAVQLALNGATHVHAMDIDRNAVANTLANAFRNGVSDRVTGEDVDLYEWQPDARYDVVVASLYQMPVDPFEEPTGHRPLDYWGRTLLDHFLRTLPEVLADGGRAFLMQLSIVGQQETSRQLEALGLRARVVDFSFFPFGPLFERNKEQIKRVEELSDAYHITLGGQDVMVSYLLEIEQERPTDARAGSA
ncbi:MAG TPA: homocysteine S-methyltransferase family protein [Gaiella sp.]|jgi:S-methylmethionine-dependent homocysteine/selenocysteine methylase